MGMHLRATHPVDPTNDTFRASWSNWATLGDLLLELGGNVDLMSGTNDGEPVDRATATTWGEAIMASLDRIVIERAPNGSGWGTGDRLRVENTTTPVPIATLDQALALITTMVPRLDPRNLHQAQTHDDTPPELHRLTDSPDTLAWVTTFATFCINSGGFTQQ